MRDKGRGLMLSAVIAAGLMLRPGGSSPPQQNESIEAGSVKNSLAPQESGEGPWIASCDYWAPVRQLETQSAKKEPEIHNTLDASNGTIVLHVNLDETSKNKQLPCGDQGFKRWGFPDNTGTSINAKAIIAIVPDPVHSHLALAFDRALDAILQAAADNGYISSYYWLPWKKRLGSLRSSESHGDTEPGHDSERERKPGLIVLKHVPSGKTSDWSDSFYEVVYLFLVSETPTEGVDGFQLQSALSYEAELELGLVRTANRFSRGRNGYVAIVGPTYSGSAASLRAGIRTAQMKTPQLSKFEVMGGTATTRALDQLTAKGTNEKVEIRAYSFDGSTKYETGKLVNALRASGYNLGRIALLVEDNTAYGSLTSNEEQLQNEELRLPYEDEVKVIRFPREISLLRNAQVVNELSGNGAPTPGSVPSPFLHFSLKDSSAQDSVPQFSRENTPVSQESQLMAIGRQFHLLRSQFIAIVASNVLDEVFLAQFLHRACPEARLVFFGGDLLMVRDIDNVPFIGSITIAPYPLIGLEGNPGNPLRAYPDFWSGALYNAASYTFWPENVAKPVLQGYEVATDVRPPSLWATVIGSDGYYPLAVLNPCASDDPRTLPVIRKDGTLVPDPCKAPMTAPHQKLEGLVAYPSRLWVALCALVFLLCLFHTLMLLAADYRSPFTRDLAIQDNDQPIRRSTYVHVATASLFSMAFVVSFPIIPLALAASVNPASTLGAVVVIGVGVFAAIVTLSKTKHYSGWHKTISSTSQDRGKFQIAYVRIRANVYLFLNLLAGTMLLGLTVLWAYLCTADPPPSGTDHPSFVGLSFSYRCIHPASGVSPVVPVLLLLLSWYLWAVIQTWRLRFSDSGRPRLPGKVEDKLDGILFVSDDQLDGCLSARDSCLYRTITCLLITRQVLCRFWKGRQGGKADHGVAIKDASSSGPHIGGGDYMTLDIVLIVVYAGLLVGLSLFAPVRSLDHFLWTWAYLSSPYEFLVCVLFLPLLAMCVTGWLRMVLIWGALRRGLLDRLENQPIRFAFSRLKVMGWMTMLRHGGLQEQWRDMARSLESIRQMLHQSDFQKKTSSTHCADLNQSQTDFLEEIRVLLGEPPKRQQRGTHDYDSMRIIEGEFAAFAHKLLRYILIPYWKQERTGLVASAENEEFPIKARRSETHLEHPSLPMALHAGPSSEEQPRVLVAEEFLAIRYISLIRAVLANMRYLMIFVSVSFVLAIVAWNSYPFQPRQQVDWLFTALLVFLGSGIIWVFAQMHRNPILSRITDTKANELGWDFYWRIISFGALPVLAWLTYQFPEIGSVISKFFQPGVPVIK